MRYALLLVAAVTLAFAQGDEVRKILKDTEDAWNRGDLVTVASFYDENATFIGRDVTHGGPDQIAARYKRGYPDREHMGTLTFSEIDVKPLGDGYALANGKFALKRTAAGGGAASGRFTLVLRKTDKGWRIIHDHSS
jgi:uncharacterized protein (TIGR02246 family)